MLLTSEPPLQGYLIFEDKFSLIIPGVCCTFSDGTMLEEGHAVMPASVVGAGI